MMLHTALENYLTHLEAQGLSKRTLYTYGKDSQQIRAFFGESILLESLTRQSIGKFLKSDNLRALPSGKERAETTINKTIGFFRRFIEWCIGQGVLSDSPLPKSLTN